MNKKKKNILPDDYMTALWFSEIKGSFVDKLQFLINIRGKRFFSNYSLPELSWKQTLRSIGLPNLFYHVDVGINKIGYYGGSCKI